MTLFTLDSAILCLFVCMCLFVVVVVFFWGGDSELIYIFTSNAFYISVVSWILSQGEPLKISKIIREMVEEYVYLEKPNQASPIRLVSIPSKEVVDNETLYFDLPEVYENETKVC